MGNTAKCVSELDLISDGDKNGIKPTKEQWMNTSEQCVNILFDSDMSMLRTAECFIQTFFHIIIMKSLKSGQDVDKFKEVYKDVLRTNLHGAIEQQLKIFDKSDNVEDALIKLNKGELQ